MDLEQATHLLIAAAKKKAQEPQRLAIEVLPDSIQVVVHDAARDEKVYRFERGDPTAPLEAEGVPCPKCGGAGIVPKEL